MTETQTAKFLVKTGAGVVHAMTVGKTYRLHGMTFSNEANEVNGKADCGALVSTAATFTDHPPTCAKCIAKAENRTFWADLL